ncbi:MAG: ABC transporter ATP-binding protein [Anaerolineales bacterium]
MSASASASTPGTASIRAVMQPRGPRNIGRIEKARDPRSALRRLLPYLGRSPVMLVMAFVSVLIYTVLGILGPYLIGVAIDQFITGKDPAGLGRIALWMLAVYALNNLFQAVAGWLMADISQRGLQLLRRDLFARLQILPVRFFDRNPAGELMSRLTNDIDAINTAVAQNITALAASVLSMGGILVAMFLLDWRLALVSLVVVPITLWFTSFVARYTRTGFEQLQRHLGELNGVMEETLSGQKVISAFRRNDSVVAAFRERNAEVYRAGIYANTYALLLMPLTTVLGNFFVIVIAAFGGFLALQGYVSVGLIAAFINYAQNFVNPVRQLANLYNTVQAALAGAERVFEIIDTAPEPEDEPGAAAPDTIRGDVRFERVDFSYNPGTPVIRDMSLEAEAGKTIALVGPTGAGKTTIINLLSRFYEVDGGRIAVDGEDIRDIRKDFLRRRLGIVLQDMFLFSTSVMDNIRYGRIDASDEEVYRAAKIADADHFIRQLPQGYGTVLSERAGNLSQGQRQLLAIARAVIGDPNILILDEATSSVDTRTEVRIQTALLRLMQGRTSFVIAHRLSTIRDADCVLVIQGGQIVERGTHQELLDRREVYYHLYISQFKGQEI